MKDKILLILQSAEDYISGEELSRQLGVSRTAVWKNINALRKQGYVINSVTNKGYLLEKSPDVLSAAVVMDGLDTVLVGTKVEVLETVDSTNNEAKRRAAQGEKSGLVIAAQEQTGGKGRLGRVWSSDRGGLYFTVLLRPELPPSDIASITLAAGYAVCLAIRKHTGIDARIKWPNDIIVGNRKIVGILTEMAAQSDMLDYVAIGIGINVNNESFPEEISGKASSLYLETGAKLDRSELLREVIIMLDKVLSSFMVSLYIDDMDGFRILCATLGRTVAVKKGNCEICGTATDITATGELVISGDDGHEYTVNSGEVTVQGIY